MSSNESSSWKTYFNMHMVLESEQMQSYNKYMKAKCAEFKASGAEGDHYSLARTAYETEHAEDIAAYKAKAEELKGKYANALAKLRYLDRYLDD